MSGPGGVPELRVRRVNDRPARAGAGHVLYWATAARRPAHSFALDRALAHCRERGLPLVVLEALRAGYPFASDRLHRFVIDGMAANRDAFRRAGVLHHAYVEPSPGAGRGLLEALAARATLVVTDDAPVFFLPRMVAAAGRRLDVLLEAVDGNGLLPLRATPRTFPSAYVFRQLLHRELGPHLADAPRARPFAGTAPPPAPPLPAAVARRWPAADLDALRAPGGLAGLPIDHDVPPAPAEGGFAAGRRRLAAFVAERLPRYSADRNLPGEDATSGLSPYLHFGHVSPHEVFAAVARAEGWAPDRLDPRARGKRAGYWGMGEDAEAFLDQLVTWRELGFHAAAKLPDHDRYEGLPPWARETLDLHRADPRPRVYDLEAFRAAGTHDEVWNAAQRQLLRDGVVHNYLRMLWGKKILHWSASPEDAFATMLELNDRYALDGRDPNSVSGIAWCLGRYDRPWGPERPVFGKVRYMSSANTARKLRLGPYLERYGAPGNRSPA